MNFLYFFTFCWAVNCQDGDFYEDDTNDNDLNLFDVFQFGGHNSGSGLTNQSFTNDSVPSASNFEGAHGLSSGSSKVNTREKVFVLILCL